MPDTPAGRIEIDTLLARQFLDVAVFPQIRVRVVLNVVVECHDDLAIIVDPGSADGEELLGDGPGVVMGHAVVGLDGDIVAGPHGFTDRETDSITLDNFLGQVLSGRWRGGGRGERADEGGSGLEVGLDAGVDGEGKTEPPPSREACLSRNKDQLAMRGEDEAGEIGLTKCIEYVQLISFGPYQPSVN